jgi:hypothetical protein
MEVPKRVNSGSPKKKATSRFDASTPRLISDPGTDAWMLGRLLGCDVRYYQTCDAMAER